MNMLTFLYRTRPGRILLKPLVSRSVSELSGRILDGRLSKLLIGSFVRKNGIRTEDYILDDIGSFNDFFCRRIKSGLRPINAEAGALTSPCDGLLSAYRIEQGTVLSVKQSKFTISRLLDDSVLAAGFEGGYALVFRLCVDHYHRYSWFESGRFVARRKLDGIFHTVRPVALETCPVFVENSREYAVLDTENFGRTVQMEVGAMLVGRIVNEASAPCDVVRGEEKGHFEYGGSTVIVLIPAGRAELREDITGKLGSNYEIPVVMGEKIGEKSAGNEEM